MGFFDKIKSFWKREKPSAPKASEVDLDKLWDMWDKGEIKSPYAQLMKYEAEVNSDGHMHFFDTAESTYELADLLDILFDSLGKTLKANLERAYRAYVKYEDDDDRLWDILDKCDNVFYENEQELIGLLEEHAKKIGLL